MKRSLLIAAVCIALSGCQAQQSPTTKSPSIEDIYKIDLNGHELTVPFESTELEASGYTLKESVFGEEVTRGADNIAYYEDSNGGLIVVNFGSKEDTCSIADAYVIDILADIGNTDTTALSVYGGITFGSAVADIENVYGDPVMNDNGFRLYSKLESDETYMDGVYVAMDEGSVMRIEVLNTQGFVDLSETEESTE